MELEDLFEVISFNGFDFNQWRTHEDTLLRPRLEALGYYAIQFQAGETDSFGPLSRVVTALDPKGIKHYFVYG